MREKILNMGRTVGLIFDCIAQACLVMLTFIGAGFLAVLLTNIWSSDGISGLGKLFFTGLVLLGTVKIGVLRTRIREEADNIQYVTGQLNHLASDIGRLNDMLREVLEAQLQATLDKEAKPKSVMDQVVEAAMRDGTGFMPTEFISREQMEKVYPAKPDTDMDAPIYYSNPVGPGHDQVRARYGEEAGQIDRDAWDRAFPNSALKLTPLDEQTTPIPVAKPMWPSAAECAADEESIRQKRVEQIRDDLAKTPLTQQGLRQGLQDELERLTRRVDAGNWPDPDYRPIEPDQEPVVLTTLNTFECRVCRGTGEGHVDLNGTASPCEACKGKGFTDDVRANAADDIDPEATIECDDCDGTGEGIEAYSDGNGAHRERDVNCPTCGGTGFTPAKLGAGGD